MKYTLTEDDGVTIVRAELRTTNDFDELVKKLLEYRDKNYFQQKEEQNKQP